MLWVRSMFFIKTSFSFENTTRNDLNWNGHFSQFFVFFFYIQLILIAGKQAFKVPSIPDNTLKKSFEEGHLWLSRKCVSTELNCRRISVIVHRSPDKLVVDSLVWIGRICLFADWVICVWQIVSNQRFVNVNKTLHCYRYTPYPPPPPLPASL